MNPLKFARSKESIVDMSGNYVDLLIQYLGNNAMTSYSFDEQKVLAQYQFGNISSLAVKQFDRFGFVGVVSHERSVELDQSNITLVNLFK